MFALSQAIGYSWTRYRIPFKRPLVTAHGVFPFREGAIVEVTDKNGVTGIGEIAPPPGFGVSLDDALAPLVGLGTDTRFDSFSWSGGQWEELPPATRFGLYTASLDIRIQTSDEAAGDGSLIPVNATVIASDVDEAAHTARKAISKGIGCIKLKVGALATVDEEVARVAVVRAAIGPDIRLRLDANEAWDFKRALAVLQAVARYDIQYCEQPVDRDDLVDMYSLRREQSIAIAADEAVTDLASVRRILDAKAADVIVLKPQCIGDIWDFARVTQLLPMSMSWVWTTSMEAGVGVSATIALARPRHPYPECGLMTLDLLEDDLIVTPPTLVNGSVEAPYRWGMLDRDALARYAV